MVEVQVPHCSRHHRLTQMLQPVVAQVEVGHLAKIFSLDSFEKYLNDLLYLLVVGRPRHGG